MIVCLKYTVELIITVVLFVPSAISEFIFCQTVQYYMHAFIDILVKILSCVIWKVLSPVMSVALIFISPLKQQLKLLLKSQTAKAFYSG